MARNYAEEYRARSERAQGRGFTGYTHQERERRRLQAIEQHPLGHALRPGFRRPGDIPVDHGLQGPFSPSPDTDPTTNIPDWDYYWPTRTINPPRPRTLQARYSARAQRIEVIFRAGSPASPDATWHYNDIPPQIWTAFKRNESPGRFINAVLNGWDGTNGGPGGWGTLVGQ
jgi:hypothetical protein